MSAPRRSNQAPILARCGALLALAVITGFAGSAAALTAPTPASPSIVPGSWAILGSSSAYGAGASSYPRSWAGRLATTYSPAGLSGIANLAVSGAATYTAMPRSYVPPSGRPAPSPTQNVDAALSQSPTLILVSFPSNDLVARYSAQEMIDNLLAIRDHARARGAAVILLSTQPRNLPPTMRAMLPAIDDALEHAARPCFVRIREPLAGLDGKIAPQYDSGDGVHVNDAGHAVIFGRLTALIDSGACVAKPYR